MNWVIRYYSASGKYLSREILRGKESYEAWMYAKLRIMKNGRYTVHEWKGS